MNKIQWAISIIICLLLIPVMMVTSVEYTITRDGYFTKKYEKLNIVQNVGIPQEDLMAVTGQMMSYLMGERESLDDINAEINGVEREFFNDKEKSHMKDVRDLFLGGMAVRKVLVGIIIALFIALFFTRGEGFYILTKALQIVPMAFLALAAMAAWVISKDFTQYFTVFHEMFFDNDLWILNPKTDLLINIVPEPFFIETAKSIGGVFALCMAALFMVGAAVRVYMDRRDNIGV